VHHRLAAARRGDSFFLLLKPLRPGRHVLTTRVVNQAGRVSGPRTIILDVGARD
jgi:hypothetical protein